MSHDLVSYIWDIGHIGNGIYYTLILIKLSVFRDYILEPRYYNPYL
jgi:hypothetical protein